MADFRHAHADLLGADPSGVVYGRSAAQSTHDFSGRLPQGRDGRGWAPGDEVVVTRPDHDSNVCPWVQAAERAGATVRWIDLDPATAELDLADRAPRTAFGAGGRVGVVRAAAAPEVTEDELLTRIERAGLEALLSPRSRARHHVRR